MLQLDLFESAETDTTPRLLHVAPTAVRSADRSFWRCADCLSVLALEDVSTTARFTCGACGGSLECMGRVERDRLVRDEHRCPCDHRCTAARGPRCDCKCNGRNHGSGLVVKVTIDAGGVPTATPYSTVRAQRVATEYREAVNAARARIDARYGAVLLAKREGRYLSPAEYGLLLAGRQEWSRLRQACAGRTHAGRLRALAHVCK